jgi:hypothetical protein
MGLFSKRPSSVKIMPGAVNVDKQANTTTGAVSLEAAKRVLRLDDDQTLMEDGIWRMTSANCAALGPDGYWPGYIKPKGNAVGIYFNNKHVGTLEARSTESGKKAIKEYGGKQARCVVRKTASGRWNVYVDMR